jgi:hypothetical protein
MATLQDQGFRFTARGDKFNWRHPLDVQRGDVDCTDMTDAEFDAFVVRTISPAIDKRHLEQIGLQAA